MHLRKPGFTCGNCRLFTKSKEKTQRFKETEDLRYIIQFKLDKPCFQHNMAYDYFKDLLRRTTSHKIFCGQTFSFAKSQKYDVYQHGLESMVYAFLDKKSDGTSTHTGT